MEIRNIREIDNSDYRSQIKQVYALTNDKNVIPETTVNNCLNTVYIIKKDGSCDRFVTSEDINERELETRDFTRFISNWSRDLGVRLPNAEGEYFEQLHLGSKSEEKQEKIGKLDRDYQRYVRRHPEEYQDTDEYDDDYDDENEKKPWSTKKKALAAGLGAAALAVGIGAGAVAYNNAKNNDAKIETQADDENGLDKPSMENQTWDYYVENAIDSTQKQFYTTLGDWLINFNKSEAWMTRTNNAGQSSTFGLTPKEAASLMLRFNEYTDEENITISNGLNINADEIMEESNRAIEKLITYYSLSGTPTGIDALFNDAHDKEVIKAFEQHHQQVMSATSDQERENLLREEKQMFYDYFNSDVEGKETEAEAASTSYILRTILPADTIVAQLYRYDDNETIYKNGSSDAISVKTSLFGEQMMCQFVTGWENFDEESYLGELGYNEDKYYVKKDGIQRSIADISCGEQEKKLRDGDTYRVELETSQKETEAAMTAATETLRLTLQADNKYSDEEINQLIAQMENNLSDDSNFNSIEELTQYTYDRDQIEAMLAQKLQELGKYPAYAETFDELLEEKFLNRADVKSSGTSKSSGSGSKSSNYKKTTTTNPQEAEAALVEMGVAPEIATEMRIEAEEKAAAAVGAERDTEEVKQKHEELNEKEEIQYNMIYGAVYNHYAGKYVEGEYSKYKQDTNLSYDSSWATSSDTRTRNTYAAAKTDALNHVAVCKQLEEDKENGNDIIGGDIDYDDDYEDDLGDIDIGNIGTDPGDSNGDSIGDIIEDGNNDNSNDNTLPPVTPPDEGIIPPPPEDLNNGNNNGGSDSNDGITDDPGDFSPVVPDDPTNELPQNPDGSFGGGIDIDDSLEEKLSTPATPESEVPAVEESTEATIDQAVEAMIQETAQQIYEEEKAMENTTSNIEENAVKALK